MTDATDRQLLAALAQAFGEEAFDTAVVTGRAWHQSDEKLAASLEVAIPNCRYRSGHRRGQFKDRLVRRTLTRLAPDHFDADRHGWWYLKSL